MKAVNLSMLIMISTLIVSCSNKGVLSPTSVDSSALSKSSLESSEVAFSPVHGRRARILAALDLTQEQRAQIKEILESQREAFKSLQGSLENRLSLKEMKAERKEMRQATQQKILAVLTPEQRAKAEAWKAQLDNGQVPDELVEKRVAALREKLDLTEDQVSQVKALIRQEKPRPAISPGENPAEFRKQRRKLAREREEQILSLLTPEQQTAYLQMKKENRAQIKSRVERFRSKRAQKRIEHLTAALDLDAAQQAQLKEIFSNVRSSVKAELNGNRGGRSREELRQAMRERISQVDAEIQKTLNAEQLKKYEALKAARRAKRQDRSSGVEN
ncbi:MAG: Spy/CpxP family protein refolding chaperone [bacterium]